MAEPTISIIVPVYKTEAYLEKCVDSILAQTFRDFELLLIDDGSPDNCPALCEEAAARDPRIRVIHQKNAGLSAARNTGVEAAHGEWIGFVDSDDSIAPEMDETGRIVELIRSMPERYREALELRFAWEYSNQEIAKALKLNTSTVATLVARGRKLLIEKLQTEGYCYE